ncbi:hypothetical protein GL218_06131 [Daldinia childiae]|uniref:uncharacterized protein n=1 Tax=Daldinia childiae TaxID=326645 RepID=UPI001446F52B|nr:uncharacterized protein GL218_06131 [Daldinia childiae]KAF3057287.1 hypothetical protein GL218_06131 [Daldinia childiae]
MLRRPPTTLTLTAEDVAALEDRRFEAMQAQLQNQTSSRATSHPLQPQPTAMDTSSSSVTPSPPRIEDDEDMQDVDVDVDADADADEADTSDPFVMAPRRAAREQFNRREQSPGQARAAPLDTNAADHRHEREYRADRKDGRASSVSDQQTGKHGADHRGPITSIAYDDAE